MKVTHTCSQFPQCISKMGKHTPLSEQGQHFSGSSCLVFRLQMNFMYLSMFVLRRKYFHLLLNKINTSEHALGQPVAPLLICLSSSMHLPDKSCEQGARMRIWLLRG